MRTYSIWDPSSKAWDYYQAQGDLGGGVFAPEPKLRGGHAAGLTVEEAARSLPAGARKVGRGAVPVGMVAGRKSMGGFIGDVGSVLVYGGVAFLVWNFVLTGAQKSKIRGALK